MSFLRLMYHISNVAIHVAVCICNMTIIKKPNNTLFSVKVKLQF